MPLYLEILDDDHSATDSVLVGGTDARILSRWTNETTGETVRLVDAPGEHESTRSTVRSMRILFC
jgi:hypothetical protein